MAKVKVNNAWKEVAGIRFKKDGEWKEATSGFQKVDGEWKSVYSSGSLLERMSWAEIASLTNPENYFSIGDEKAFTLTTGEEIVVQIYDFYHDNLVAGGKAKITFGMKGTTTNTSSRSVGSFPNSGPRNTFYNNLPEDLKTHVKQIRKTRYDGDSWWRHQEDPGYKTSNVYCFGFSQIELNLGEFKDSFSEGTPYPIFTDSGSRIKENNGEKRGWWFERGNFYSTTSNAVSVLGGFNSINTSGNVTSIRIKNASGDLTYTSQRDCFGFCV